MSASARPPAANAAAGGRAVLGVIHSAPGFDVPAGACDCHVHVYPPPSQFAFAADRLYTPDVATLEDLRARQRALGLQRAVIVQSSAYGTDNACLRAALGELGGAARGVAVVAAGVPDAELDALAAAGVRGLRINLESAGERDPASAARALQAAAGIARGRGWHVQVYTHPDVLLALRPVVESLPVPLVLDHFGRVDAAGGSSSPGFLLLRDWLRDGRVYVKLSAPRRVARDPDGEDAAALARGLIEANPDRLLWGSDWPHGGAWPGVPRTPDRIEPFHPVDDGAALARLNRWAGAPEVLRRILVDNPARLYGF
ncbi:amidohydrolase family protein [Pigmentiphaga soli]|uniref:Amidohydrolase family protein n=1 Tax=Pigmentiphaga soli TaxID=1007095 RepID=A0ABP8GXM9_9BURK